MLLVEWLDSQQYIVRKCRTDAGWVIEVVSDFSDENLWKKKFLDKINRSDIDSTSVELIYSIYVYKNIKDRFSLDGTLRQTEMSYNGTMSATKILSGDLYGKITPYDFDVLTLTDNEEIEIFFSDDKILPNIGLPNRFKELDVHGSQFEVIGDLQEKNGNFSIKVKSGMSY